MAGRVFGLLSILGVICAIITSNTGQLGAAAMAGAESAVNVTLKLIGTMALWSGVMRVYDEAGASRFIARITAPLLRRLFPNACRSGSGISEATAAVTANMLGLGNAATPFSIAAMKALAANNTGDKSTADCEMITFAVLMTASLDIMPTSLIALRGASGSSAPGAILVPVWICSFICAASGVLLTKLIGAVTERLKKPMKNNGRTVPLNNETDVAL